MSASAASEESGAAVLQQLMAVTAADAATAAALLTATGGDLQRAVNLHFESDGASSASSGAPPAVDGARVTDSIGNLAPTVEFPLGDGDVRAPIAPRADVMLEPSHMASNYAAPTRRGRLRQVDSVFDRFRDFSAEIRLQESLMMAGESSSRSSRLPPRSRKLRTLEEIFRPPVELLFAGTFQAARDLATAQCRWLLVNVQNSEEFACQVLNRDVWSAKNVREIVSTKFVLWQVYHESGEGLKYRTFYPVSSWPYVAVLDPRTGELLRTWNRLDRDTAADQFSEFLETHAYSDEAVPPPPKTAEQEEMKSSTQKRQRERSVLEMDEEEQLRLAIEKSLQPEPTSKRRATVDDASDPSDEEFLPSSGDMSPLAQSQAKGDDTAAGENTSSSGVSSEEQATTSSADAAATSGADSGCEEARPSGSNARNVKIASGDNTIAPTDSCVSNKSVDVNVTQALKVAAGHTETDDPSSDRKRTSASAAVGGGAAAGEEWRLYLGAADDPRWTLALRLPDGGRTHLQLPCSSRLRCLTAYVAQLGYAADSHQLLTTFPRRVLSDPARADQTLQQAGLHSQDTVFVQAR